MNLFSILFAIFLMIPALEIYLFIKIGAIIHAGPVILLIILTALVGGWLVRQQSLSTLARLRETLNKGELPATEMMEAVILLVCGVMLVTPGFFTDFVGFLGLVPYIRRTLVIKVWERNVKSQEEFTTTTYTRYSKTKTDKNKVIEAEYWRKNGD